MSSFVDGVKSVGDAVTDLAEWLAPRAKAVIGFLAPIVIMTVGLARDGDGLTLDDVLLILSVAGGTSGAVYAVGNRASRALPRD